MLLKLIFRRSFFIIFITFLADSVQANSIRLFSGIDKFSNTDCYDGIDGD